MLSRKNYGGCYATISYIFLFQIIKNHDMDAWTESESVIDGHTSLSITLQFNKFLQLCTENRNSFLVREGTVNSASKTC